MSLQDRDFFLTIEHPCAYFDDRSCQNVVPDPQVEMHAEVYDQLAVIGFRRSGDHVYRPHCPGCKACVPCRLKVANFKASRSQRRCLKKNQDLTLSTAVAEYSDEYFDLYKRYLNQRHADGDMKDPTAKDFKNFLVCDWSNSSFLCFRENDKLLAVAVIDKVVNGYSAVYTFYDPDYAQRGLGTYAILKQVEYCQQQRMPYLYLGYWIDEHPKMHYKTNFDAAELFHNNQWRQIET